MHLFNIIWFKMNLMNAYLISYYFIIYIRFGNHIVKFSLYSVYEMYRHHLKLNQHFLEYLFMILARGYQSKLKYIFPFRYTFNLCR